MAIEPVTCPSCGSTNIPFDVDLGSYSCPSCHSLWSRSILQLFHPQCLPESDSSFKSFRKEEPEEYNSDRCWLERQSDKFNHISAHIRTVCAIIGTISTVLILLKVFEVI